MGREIRLILLVLIFVIVPTALLSILAGLSLRNWEAVVAARLARRAAGALGDASEAVDAAVEAAAGRWFSAVEAAREEPGRARRLLAAARRIRGEEPLLGKLFVLELPETVVYPPPWVYEPGPDWGLGAAPAVSPAVDRLLETAESFRRQSDWETAAGVYESIVREPSASEAVRAEARVQAARCLATAGRLDAAAGLLALVAAQPPFGGGTRPEGAGDEAVCDEDGWAYALLAGDQLARLQAVAGQRDEALASDLGLADSLLRHYPRIGDLQRRDLLAKLRERLGGAAAAGPKPDAAAAEALLALDELDALRRAPPARPPRWMAALAHRLEAQGPARPRELWLQGEGTPVLAAPVPGAGALLAACELDGAEVIRVAQRAAAQASASGDIVVRIEEPASRARRAAAGPGAVQRPLPALPDGLVLAAAPADPDRLERSRRLFTRLSVWGMGLLGTAVVFGTGFVLWYAAHEIRQARARGDFVASISHDFRTPLASMRMLAETLQVGQIRDAAKQRTFLEAIIRECDRLNQLIERALFFVRFGQDALTYHMGEHDPAAFVRAVVESFLARFKPGDVAVGLEAAGALPPVLIDRPSMAQVILNLLDNALKYSPRGRPIAIRVERSKAGVSIAVEDKGIGIPRRHQRRIFRKFYRVDRAERSGVAGVGLGLSLCRRIVRAHRGRIGVRSAQGQGSTFTVWLPAAGGRR